MTHYVAGVDGCPAGWIAVIHPLSRPASAHLVLFSSFRDVLEHQPELNTIAVDIPIGLPDRAGAGGRAADREARSVLGQRQSAVFAVPSRRAIMCENYRDACDAAYATSDPPRKISKQAFNIFPKIRDVDAIITPAMQARVFEAHPEIAFWCLNGEVPLRLAKKIKSRPSPEGLDYRRALLRTNGYPEAVLLSSEFRKSKVGPDDILDACANAWSAVRIHTNLARCFPEKPERDAKGLRMEIWG